jgi:DNA-directed RNA polymerase specialized sigma24 family protein
MSDREWEWELRQAIVLADMYGASRDEIAAVFERAMSEVSSR